MAKLLKSCKDEEKHQVYKKDLISVLTQIYAFYQSMYWHVTWSWLKRKLKCTNWKIYTWKIFQPCHLCLQKHFHPLPNIVSALFAIVLPCTTVCLIKKFHFWIFFLCNSMKPKITNIKQLLPLKIKPKHFLIEHSVCLPKCFKWLSSVLVGWCYVHSSMERLHILWQLRWHHKEVEFELRWQHMLFYVWLIIIYQWCQLYLNYYRIGNTGCFVNKELQNG